jgi:hypothetical protein
MAWLQSAYTIRLNHRHKLIDHVLSGRYKAQLVDGSGNGYLRTACDYVHLNPVRAGLLKPEERLLAYPWSSFGYYLAAPAHRPQWMRVDRLLGEHGLQQDTLRLGRNLSSAPRPGVWNQATSRKHHRPALKQLQQIPLR